jgi:hypothetical protein
MGVVHALTDGMNGRGMRSAAASSKARERRFGTSLRALFLLAIGASFVLAATPARAACALTDLACVTETVTEAADDVTEPITEVTDQVIGTVGGVVDEVEDTVDPIVDEVPLPDPPVNVTEPPTTADSGVGSDPRTGPGTPRGDSGNGSSDPGPGSPAERPIPVQALVGGAFVSGLDPSPSSDVRIGPSPPAERTGVSLEDVVKGFAFPLGLALIVGAFLLVQDRLDRRDPRLALAPVGPDVLDFT